MALGRNITFPIYNDDGSSFHGLELRRSSVESLVMSLSDKITGDVYYNGGVELEFTMKEYVMYNDVKYTLVSPPTIVREGMTADNSELKGTTKYSFEFYHPMYWLANYPFSDVAVTSSESRYKSHDKSFSWIGTIVDYVAKLNKNLEGTEWVVSISSRVPQADLAKLSEVLTFNNNSIADALKTGYDTYSLPYVIDSIKAGETYYSQGKRFLISFGLPPNEIYDSGNIPYVFQFGKGVGLKNNSRTPRKNKIITRIAGYGSENNIPYGYPQIVWTGSQDATETADGYPLYDGIVGGLVVKLIKHPFTRTHLMPSIYVDRVRRKVNSAASDYNPSIELIDYYDADSSYPNPINPVAPNYEIHEFSDIKPELGQESIVSAAPLNQDLTPASDWDDTMDDDGNYIQSYFQITLPILSFDIYACAAITEAMQINMRSGGCIGCTFDVQVDWDDYKKNFFDSQGNFLPNGEQRDLTKYPKSNEEQISIIVQKDLNTFGTLMPNRYQYPHGGDDFVVLGISLPTSYITNAQTRLDAAMQSFMLANNVHYFDYPLKFDEYFLATRTDLLSQIRNNSILRFAFGSEELELFVKQIVIKYGQGVLPQYDITLTDDIEVVLNQIGQVQEDVDNLTTVISALRQSFSNNVWVELAKKLSKVSDDTAHGFITFLQGLQVGQRFVSGLLGEGGVFRRNADGSTYIEADTLYIRMKAYFDTVEFRRFINSGGNRIASPAGGKCVRVEVINDNIGIIADSNNYSYSNGNITAPSSASYSNGNITLPSSDTHAERTGVYRCYFRATDGDGNEVHNEFQVGDQAFCHISNIRQGSLTMHHFWRLVVGRNDEGVLTENDEYWIDLSMDDCEEGSDAPVEQDSISALGHRTDTTRQGAIIEYVTGNDSPSYQIYQGINSYSLADKNYLSLGYSSVTNRAYMNVYGDFFFGNKEQEDGAYTGSYLRYDAGTKQLDIRATINAYSTIDGQSLENYIKGHQNNWTDEQIENLIFGSTEYTSMEEAIADIQSQVDGAIETWYFDADPPTLSNAPAVDWTTDDLKDQHIGDLYYSGQGNAYRFVYNDQTGVYSWVQLSDDAIAEALRIARDAKDTADGKRKVFVRQPNRNDTYDEGDLWVNATYPSGNIVKDADNDRYYLDLLRVKDNVHKASGTSFDIGHWELATNYIDKSYVDDWVTNTYAPFVRSIQGQVDGKAETWYQATDPSANWDATQKQEHIGDIWHNSSGSTINGVEAGQDAIWDGTSWKISTVPHEVFDIMDGKAQIFVSIPNVVQPDGFCYRKNDCWILEASYALYNGVTYKQGELVTAMTDSTVYNPNHWKKSVRYTDDEKVNSLVNQILNGTGASGDVATVGNALNALSQALRKDNATTTEGALLLTTLIGMRDANHTIWGGISGAYNSTLRGNGIAAWYGGAMVDIEALTGDDKNVYDAMTPAQKAASSAYAKSVDRFDGSGYRASGNISWDAQGSLTIQNIHTLYGDDGSDLLQGYTKITSMFDNSQWVSEVRIQPLQAFDHINLVRGTGNPRYDIGDYSVLNYGEMKQRFLTVEFFNKLFRAIDVDDQEIAVNGTTDVSSIKAMVGLWTNSYLSSLGLNSSSGGGGGATTLNQLEDVDTSGATAGQVLTYTQVGSTYKWAPTTVSGGGGGLDPTAMWAALATSGSQQIDASHLSDALGNYLPLMGGTLTGGLTARTITPASNNTYALGSDEKRWNNVYTGGIYSTYFSFHSGGFFTENSSQPMWNKGSNSYTIIHEGNIDDYVDVESITLSTTGSGNAFTSASLSNGTLTLTKGSTFLTSQSLAGYATQSWVNTQLGDYVTLDTAQIITAIKQFDATIRLNGYGIEDVSGQGLLVYNPSGSWSGISSSQWGVGAGNCQGVIRSSANHLVHYRGGTNYNILDTFNAPKWTLWIYPESGTPSFTGSITSNSDLNDYLDAGTYYCQNGTVAGTLTNTPYTAGNFRLWNIYNSGTNGASSGSWFAQLILAPNEGNFYIRSHSNNTFGAWARLFKSTGGAITGNVTFSNATNINFYDTGGTSRSVVNFSANNNVNIGYGAANTGSGTYIYGKTLVIRIGGTSATYNALTIDSSKNAKFEGEVTALSDIRQKSQISNVNTRIEDAADLPIFYFKWKAGHDDNMHIGTSAQAVQKLFPELVLGGEELSVNYGVLGTTLGILNSRKLTEHERRILDLEKENKALRREINKLKGVVK